MDLAPESFEAAVAAFRRAVSIAGTQVEFARICGCTPANIQQLLKKGSLLPGRFVLKVAAAYGVPPAELRPDLYPPEPPIPSPELPPATERDGAPARAAPSSNLVGEKGTCDRSAVLQPRQQRFAGEALA